MTPALVLWITLLGSLQAGSGVLDESRSLIRQGQLQRAQVGLIALGELGDASVEASRQLLLGNIHYERGEFERALSRYESAAGLLRAAGVTGADPALRAAESNLEMAADQVVRQDALASAATRLRLAVGAALLAGVLLVVALYRASRPRGVSRAGSNPA
jgi:hypothetical protein